MSIPLKPDSVKFAVPRRRRARTWVTHLGCRVTETIAIEACQIMTVVTLETKQEEESWFARSMSTHKAVQKNEL